MPSKTPKRVADHPAVIAAGRRRDQIHSRLLALDGRIEEARELARSPEAAARAVLADPAADVEAPTSPADLAHERAALAHARDLADEELAAAAEAAARELRDGRAGEVRAAVAAQLEGLRGLIAARDEALALRAELLEAGVREGMLPAMVPGVSNALEEHIRGLEADLARLEA